MATLEPLWEQGRALMDAHGLTDWVLEYSDQRSKNMGWTDFARKAIVLSAPHMLSTTEFQRRDTVLHEIAHAIAGVEADHGPMWKYHARRVGANPRSTAHDAGLDYADFPVIGHCPEGHKFGKSRMPRGTRLCANSICRYKSQDDRVIVFARQTPKPLDPEVVAAVKAHGRVEKRHHVHEGMLVEIVGTATKWEGKTGAVESVGPVNCVVRIEGIKLRIAKVACEPIGIAGFPVVRRVN